MRSFLLILLLSSSLQANAYVYRIDPNNKYHTAPPVILEDEHIGSKTGEAIGTPIGYVVGGVVGVVAGLLTGIAEGIDKGLDRTL
jgi:hypothetical protein